MEHLVFPYMWFSFSQDNGWQVLPDIYTCMEAKDMPSDIKLCVLTLVYVTLLEPNQVHISVCKMTFGLVYG